MLRADAHGERGANAYRKNEADAGHLVDNQALKAEEEDAEVMHPLQHRGDSRNVDQVSSEEQTQQQNLHSNWRQSETTKIMICVLMNRALL